MNHPRLRDSKKALTNELYELGHFPEQMIKKIGAHIVYMLHIGRKDIIGDDWGDIFADVIGGKHFSSPLGVADVSYNGMAWSMKTVKNENPFSCKNLRLISGRCSPDFSFGITDPHSDIQRTGQAVLAVWNERINIAYEEYNPVRVNVLVRNSGLTEFCLFEEYIERYRTADFVWEENKNGNLIGKRKDTGDTFFTWQPHGSQFTIHTRVPEDAVKFTVKKPPIVSMDEALKNIHFDESWVQILKNNGE
ncbi:MAG: hypothetical protein MJZ67_04085 [Bacteroidales bacterium]|nr:hypothetical protein [Bacteroidales bacterium]